MNTRRWVSIGLLLALVLLAGLWLWNWFVSGSPDVGSPGPADLSPAGAVTSALVATDQWPDASLPEEDASKKVSGAAEVDSGEEWQPEEVVEEEPPTPREQALSAWESAVDQVLAQPDVPAAAQAPLVKQAFDNLDPEDQMDGIHLALNLLPDEQFAALQSILYDKAEPPDALDAIFSDALNRAEEIKIPLMQKLRKDRAHPMFPESLRILEVIESQD